MKSRRAARLLWGLVLLSIPVTSFRYFPFLGDGTFVRPLAAYPLALLYFVFLIQLLRGEFSFPKHGAFTLLLAFFLIVLLAIAAGALTSPVPVRGNTYWRRALRSSITLGIGLAFFFAAYLMTRDMDDLRYSLRWLYAGMALTLVWGGIQAIAFYTPLLTKGTVSSWQRLFSIRGVPKLRRVSGLAFEPSWLAGELAMLYFPWLAASILSKQYATSKKWIEWILLFGGLVLLVLTYSRGGLLIVAVAAFLTLLIAGRKRIRDAWKWFIQRPSAEKKGRNIALRAGIVLLVVTFLFGSAVFLSKQKYVSRLWEVSADSLPEYFIKTSTGGRITYTWASASIFLDHPWLGTGLGCSGLRIYDNLPDWSLTHVPEIAIQLTPKSKNYPNPKDMYARLLAETGLIGTVIFLAFFLFIFGEALRLLQSKEYAIVGIAGIFSWISVMMFFLMQDSFAKPEIWLTLAIVLRISRKLSPEGVEENAA